jgi:hypothetical protein
LDKRSSYYYNTRQEARGVLREVPEAEARLDLADRSWCWRASKSCHSLPSNIKFESKLRNYKTELRAWVTGNMDT